MKISWSSSEVHKIFFPNKHAKKTDRAPFFKNDFIPLPTKNKIYSLNVTNIHSNSLFMLHKNTSKLIILLGTHWTLLTDPLGTLDTTLRNNTDLVSMCLMKQIEWSIFQSFKHFCLRRERECSITVVQVGICISFTECKSNPKRL